MFVLNYWLREYLLSAFANRFELRCEPKRLMLLYYKLVNRLRFVLPISGHVTILLGSFSIVLLRDVGSISNLGGAHEASRVPFP